MHNISTLKYNTYKLWRLNCLLSLPYWWNLFNYWLSSWHGMAQQDWFTTQACNFAGFAHPSP